MAQQINDSLYTLNKYVDETLQPFNDFASLASFSNVFNGLTAVVNNNGLPITLYYDGEGNKKYYWKIKHLPVFTSFAEISAITEEIVSTLSTKKNASRAFYVGLEATVQSGETTGEIEKYIVTEVTDGVPTWELMTMPSTDIKDDAKDVVDKVMNGSTGNVVYTNDMIYSYQPSGESGETIYTTVKEEAEGQPGYTEYPAGFYAIIEDSSGNACLASVVTNNKTDGLSIEIIGDDVE